MKDLVEELITVERLMFAEPDKWTIAEDGVYPDDTLGLVAACDLTGHPVDVSCPGHYRRSVGIGSALASELRGGFLLERNFTPEEMEDIADHILNNQPEDGFGPGVREHLYWQEGQDDQDHADNVSVLSGECSDADIARSFSDDLLDQWGDFNIDPRMVGMSIGLHKKAIRKTGKVISHEGISKTGEPYYYERHAKESKGGHTSGKRCYGQKPRYKTDKDAYTHRTAEVGREIDFHYYTWMISKFKKASMPTHPYLVLKLWSDRDTDQNQRPQIRGIACRVTEYKMAACF